jgi:DNA-binding transcriptional ArsR family regulator
MSSDVFQPEGSRTIIDAEGLRAYANPTRLAILAALADAAKTLTGVARELGTHPANLKHHFTIMEKAGLIRLVEKRDTGRNLEKYYRAVARSFTASPGELDSRGKKTLALSVLRDELGAAIRRIGRKDDGEDCIALLASARISRADVRRFTKKLEALVREYQTAGSQNGTAYSLGLCLFPGFDAGQITGTVRIPYK